MPLLVPGVNMTFSIVRAFLVEEAKIVKKVMKQAAKTTKK
jgi:hypothetical protein